jgi:hypothetical protein
VKGEWTTVYIAIFIKIKGIKMKFRMLKTAFAGLVLSASCVANAGLIDLSSWTATPGGNWNVDATNTSVYQTINGEPTFFLSNTNYINTQFDGTFGVTPDWDDDFIGFAFGYNNSNDYLLFDWKQTDQSTASSGFTLSRITGSNVNLWDHTGADISVLASNYTGNNGWVDGVTYNFNLDFTTTNISIEIDNVNIFDVAGTFNTGKFGFYNYSQSGVRYTGFEETASRSIPEPTSLAIFALGLMGLVSRRFKK